MIYLFVNPKMKFIKLRKIIQMCLIIWELFVNNWESSMYQFNIINKQYKFMIKLEIKFRLLMFLTIWSVFICL